MIYIDSFRIGLMYGMGFGAFGWLIGYAIGKAMRFIQSVGR